MSTQTTTALQESLNKIVKKSGKTLAEVQTAYTAALTTLPPSYTDANKQKYALKIVNRDFTINTKSTAVAYEGIIVGTGRTRDLMKGLRTRAITSYNENPEAALSTGLVKLEDLKYNYSTLYISPQNLVVYVLEFDSFRHQLWVFIYHMII